MTYWVESEDKAYRRERILREMKKYKTLENTYYETEEVDDIDAEKLTVVSRKPQPILKY